jgi:hypothetical protein
MYGSKNKYLQRLKKMQVISEKEARQAFEWDELIKYFTFEEYIVMLEHSKTYVIRDRQNENTNI